MLETEDTPLSEEQGRFLTEISIEQSRLEIIKALADELGVSFNQVVTFALVMGLGALCQPLNSAEVRWRFIARD